MEICCNNDEVEMVERKQMKDNEARNAIKSLEAKLLVDRSEITQLRCELQTLAFKLGYKFEIDAYFNFVARPICKECGQ